MSVRFFSMELYCTCELWGNSSRLLYVFMALDQTASCSLSCTVDAGRYGWYTAASSADRPVSRTGRTVCIRGRGVVLWKPMSKCLLCLPSSAPCVHFIGKANILLLLIYDCFSSWEVIHLDTFYYLQAVICFYEWYPVVSVFNPFNHWH